jgi:EmrB/QacA subfamily drug resistance transporter
VSSPAQPAPAAQHTTPIIAVLLLAGLAYALSQTMVFPALPVIAEHHHAGDEAASWVLTSFFLSASVATPIFGKLGDLYGKDRVLPVVLALLCLGSVMCALAPSIGWVIAGRAVQGVAGGIFPLSFGIIRDTFPPERVAGAIGLLSAVFGVGGGIGLPMAGILAEHAGVPWLFWSGLIIALPAAVGVTLLVPRSPRVPGAKVDWLGAALLSAGLVLLLLGVTEANTWGWGSPKTIGLLAAGLVVLAIWLQAERTVSEPLIDLRLLRLRAVLATNVATFLIGFAMFAAFALIPRFVQAPESTGYGFGDSVTTAGLLLLPSALIQLLIGPLAGRLGARFGFRATLMTGSLLSVFSYVLLVLRHETPFELLLAGIFLGAGVAFGFASMANLIVAAVPQSDVGVATGINTIMRTAGGAFGSAAVTAILAGNIAADTGLPTESGYTAAFVAAVGVGLLSVLAASLVPRRPSRAAPGVAAAPAAAG